MKKFAIYTLLLFCVCSTFAQSPAKPKPKTPIITLEATTADGRKVVLSSDGTWQFAPNSPTLITSAKSGFNINIEAALVYKSGEVVPVSRTEMYLFKRDLSEVIATPELKTLYESDAKAKRLNFGTADLRDYVQAIYKYASLYPSYAVPAKKALSDEINIKTQTDFSGKANFENIPSGKYFLVVIAPTRKSMAVWSMPITLEKDEKIILDQNNAAAIF